MASISGRHRQKRLNRLEESIYGAILDVFCDPETAAKNGDIRIASFLLDNEKILRHAFKWPLYQLLRRGGDLAADLRMSTENANSPVRGPTSHADPIKKSVLANVVALEEYLAFATHLAHGLSLASKLKREAPNRGSIVADLLQTKTTLELMWVPISFFQDYCRFEAAANMISV